MDIYNALATDKLTINKMKMSDAFIFKFMVHDIFGKFNMKKENKIANFFD